MKQFFIIIILALGLTFPATAQVSLGAGVAPAIPVGDFRQFTNVGFGFNLKGRYVISERLGLGLGVGWYNFNTPYDEINYRITPITATIEYYFSSINQPTPYIGLDIGSYTFNYRDYIFRVSDPYFGLAPTLGISYPLSDQFLFDGNVQCSLIFSNFENTIYIPIHLGMRYNFGK